MFENLIRFLNPSRMVEVEEPKGSVCVPSIILIHGANASPTSFNYLKAHLPPAEYHIIDYPIFDSFETNLNKMISEIDARKEYHILSHSLGGIYAMHLTRHLKIKSSISISTPFGGAAIADWARYMMPQYQLFRDVSTKSKPITEIQKIKVDVPWKQIVTTRGSVPWMRTPNDGVVTVSSMSSRNDVENIILQESHNEVLLSDELVLIIKKEFF